MSIAKRNTAIGPQVSGRLKGGGVGAGLRVAMLFIVVLSLVGGMALATQHFAAAFNYHPALGTNYKHVYWPTAIIGWWTKYHAIYPAPMQKALSLALLVPSGGILAAAILKLMAGRDKGNPFLHGSARWAGRSDIEAAGLLDNDKGVYVGQWADKSGKLHYLRHSGPEHVLTYAPTRSGKGVGLVVPTLLSWPESAVVADLKGELWALTAGWRKEFANNIVIKFEPGADKGSARWNPLDEIRQTSEHRVADVQDLATLIVDPDGKGLETHWQKTSQALLVGVILHALNLKVDDDDARAKRRRAADAARARGEDVKDDNSKPMPAPTMNSIDRMLSNPEVPVKQLWQQMMAVGPRDPVVSSAAQDMIDRPDEEAGSVLSTAKSYLSLYRDPVVAANTSSSDFRIRQIMNSEKPISLYIITQPNAKARLRPLVRILMNMIVRLNADRMTFHEGRPDARYKHRLLAMIDEFPSLGKLNILQESLAFLAGYGIKFYLICQDINQLKSREEGYGPDETITSNCHVQNAFPPNRIETAEHLSKLTGQTTIVQERITTSGSGFMSSNKSRTIQEVQRPLLTPDECLRMPGPTKDGDMITEPGDMVIYVAGFPAIYGRQPLFFKDPKFLKRSRLAAPKKSDTIPVEIAA